jgi:predicted dehydrogenase
MLLPTVDRVVGMPAGARHRYAIVGTGGRAAMYVDATCGTYAESSELVGLCDPSTTRMRFHNERLAHKFGLEHRPEYDPRDFERMLREQRPDTVIVTTLDAHHDDYIVRAMDVGSDVLTEKPMTTDATKARAIFDAIERTGRSLRVAFNYRYAPGYTALRKVIADGLIGTPMLVDFHWMLDTSHGADYFRRWHRQKINSGGLLVHKATHHFDLVNWWIDAWPEEVFARGGLRFYGPESAASRGESYSYDRYTDVPEAEGDPFALSLRSHRGLQGLYLDAEEETGYVRDQNVFAPGITIEDTMAVTARYRTGTLLSYSLVAYSPWEGLRVAITGDKGRVELYERHGSHIIAGQGIEELAAAQARGAEQSLRLFPMFGVPTDVEIPRARGDHGGGDAVMLDHLFSPSPPPDPYHRAASHLDGAASVLVGISANESMRTGQAVRCDDLLQLP